jgi:hypothetical protein
MYRRLLWCGPPLLAAGILLFALLGNFRVPDARAGGGAGNHAERDRKVSEALRDVIERGRALYNDNRDYTGCYRIYEGALLAVRPLLNHRPDLQKEIHEGLAQAERIPINWQQAHALRKVIDRVRETVRTPAGAPAADKQPADRAPKDVKPEPPKDTKIEDKVPLPPADKPIVDKRPVEKDKPILDRKVGDKQPLDKDKLILDKKTEDKVKSGDKGFLDKDKVEGDKRSEDKKPADRKIEGDKKKEDKEPPADQASVKGQALFQGKPLTSGFVTFVDPEGRKYSASIKADGSYAFKGVTLPPGEYKVIIENSVSLGKGQERGAEVPQRFQSPETSGLTATLERGQNVHDLNLR